MDAVSMMNLLEISLLFQSFSICLSSVFGERNTKDYLKKEHSLTKPYSGSYIEENLIF